MLWKLLSESQVHSATRGETIVSVDDLLMMHCGIVRRQKTDCQLGLKVGGNAGKRVEKQR